MRDPAYNVSTMAERPRRDGGDTAVAVPKTKSKKETRRPTLFKVLLHNDDFTTQEFVDWVLMTVFNHDPESAHRIMLNVHMHGVGVAGIYPHEIAETKAQKTMALAREAEYPLLATLEPE
jgi:ATP-dependent Clp protease adaptor protein ClpS